MSSFHSSVGDGSNAIKYLGSYVCKGPISDSRILRVEGGNVAFTIKDRDNDKAKVVELEGLKFVRRYLQHALPSGLHAIRYHGFLHHRSKAKLAAIRQQLGNAQPVKVNATASHPVPEGMTCPRCSKPMELTGQLARAPPWQRTIPRIWQRKQKAAA